MQLPIPTTNSSAAPGSTAPSRIDATWLRELALKAGADDAGLVDISRSELDDQRDDVISFFPWAKTLLAIVVRTNREPIRSTARSVANLEFHSTGHDVDAIGRKVARALEDKGVRAVNPGMGFPMEMDRFPGKVWTVSHKPVAVAAGLGKMGIHRSVIHPKFGSFILLGTIVTDADVTETDVAIDYDPCLGCKLCVAACPVGAIAPDGHFDFSACYSHNYREFMGGYTDYIDEVANAKNATALRGRVTDSESASWWQSLSFGANYKAAYCIGVCPAGEDVIAPFKENRKGFLKDIVKPFQEKEETLYVLENSDAEAYAAKRFPHKTTKRVGNSLRPNSIEGFLKGMPLVFQRGASKGLDATYHFTFTGAESHEATVVIRDRTVTVDTGHVGEADLGVIADSATWIAFLRKERGIVPALLLRRIKLSGPARLLLAFGKCFP